MAIQVSVNPGLHGALLEGMPDVQLDSSLRAKRMLGKIMKVHGPVEPKGHLIADGLVRLIDKTILEYRDAKAALIEFSQHGYIDNYHRAQDHLESCVHSLHRAILYLDRLRSMGYRTEDGTPLVARPRDLEVLTTSVKQIVREFRDLLEHQDKDILDGILELGDEVGPTLGSHEASIGNVKIAYVDLMRWCEQIHAIAARLSVVKIVTR